MFIQPLRRRIAFLIYPEITLEITHAGVATRRGRRTEGNRRLANQIRELDRVYSVYGGRVLTIRNMPAYTGPTYEWGRRYHKERFRQNIATVLNALRRDTAKTVHRTTHFSCINYFASIWPADAPWPADLEWPRDIPRPSAPPIATPKAPLKSRKAVA